MKIILTAAVILAQLCPLCQANAQDFKPGFVLPVSGDSLRGFVKINGSERNPEGCTFKRTETDQTSVVYTRTDIRAFGLDNFRHYRLLEFAGEQLFFQTLVDGTVIDLYTINHDFITQKTLNSDTYSTGQEKKLQASEKFFIEKDGPLQELRFERQIVNTEKVVDRIVEKKYYVGTLRVAMMDCPAISESIDRTPFNENALTKLVVRYHDCVRKGVTDIKKDLPVFASGFNIKGGLALHQVAGSASKYQSGYSYLREYKTLQPRPIIGAGVSISTPRLLSRFSINADLLYTSFDTEHNGTDTRSTASDYSLHIKYVAVMVPFTMGYSVDFGKKLQMKIRGGLNFAFLGGDFFTIRQYPGGGSSYRDDHPPIRKKTTALAAGLDFIPKKGRGLTFGFRADTMGGMTKGAVISFSSNVYSFTGGFTF